MSSYQVLMQLHSHTPFKHTVMYPHIMLKSSHNTMFYSLFCTRYLEPLSNAHFLFESIQYLYKDHHICQKAYLCNFALFHAAVIPDTSKKEERPKDVSLKMWRTGFTVNDGPLRAYEDPANAEFLNSIRRRYKDVHSFTIFKRRLFGLWWWTEFCMANWN